MTQRLSSTDTFRLATLGAGIALVIGIGQVVTGSDWHLFLGTFVGFFGCGAAAWLAARGNSIHSNWTLYITCGMWILLSVYTAGGLVSGPANTLPIFVLLGGVFIGPRAVVAGVVFALVGLGAMWGLHQWDWVPQYSGETTSLRVIRMLSAVLAIGFLAHWFMRILEAQTRAVIEGEQATFRERERMFRDARLLTHIEQSLIDLVLVATPSLDRVEFSSSAVETLFPGLSPSGILDSSDRLRERLEPEQWRSLQEVSRTGGSIGLRVGPQDAQRVVQVRAHRTQSNREEDRTVLVMHDLTEEIDGLRRVAIQDQELRQVRRLALVGRLAGSLVHDLNNLFTVMAGAAGLVAQNAPASAQGDLQEILRVVRSGSELMRQLRDFATADPHRAEPVDLRIIVEEAEGLVDTLLPDTVALRLEVSDLPVGAMAVQAQVERVMVNLVVNSTHALPDGGEVMVRAYTEDGYSILEVTDNGVGMSEDVQARCLEPFFTTRPDSGGTGLGLATCYGLATQWGGTLTIDSEPGHGTTVRMRLPFIELDPSAAPESVDAIPVSTSGARLLLVEDDERIGRVLSRALSAAGYEVEVAGTIAEALKCEMPDLLVCDWMLPDGTGGQLLSRFQTLGSPKVIFITGLSDPRFPEGMRHHPVLRKPFGPQALLAAVDEMLR